MELSVLVNSDVNKLLLEWAAVRPDEVVFRPESGYYSANVVVDAYKDGFEKGLKNSTENFIKGGVRKIFVQKANLLINCLNETIDALKEKEYNVSKLFINHNLDHSKIILVIESSLHHNIEFIQYAYTKTTQIQDKYFNTDKLLLSISFIDDVEHLNTELLKIDGYEIGYDVIKKAQIEY